jgi:hypothetical protein
MVMGKISKLLKWGKKVTLKDANGKVLMDVWLRILDDDDLEEAYRDARIASASLRTELRDPDSKRHQDDIARLENATKEECILIIKAAKGSNLTSEAFSNVVRPELPKMEEIAVDPDAPTLEENERLDAAIAKVNDEYAKAIDDYVEARSQAIDAELNARDRDDLLEEARNATVDLLVLSFFIQKVQDEKIWRGTYNDAKYTERGFDDILDFTSTDSGIKEQLREAYNELELNPEELKN